MPAIPRDDIPAFVRRCWNSWRKANIHTREAELERLRFYAGDQWREEEISKRRASGRPYIVVNKCKPAVDQVEGDIRLNPPGPKAIPVGEHDDAVDPDIIEGLIREVEYRSGAMVAYSTAAKYCAAGGYGVIELATEYVNDRDDTQRLRIDSVEDPSTVFFDPTARMANRQDAKWSGKIKQYSRDEYIQAFGKNRKVLQPGGVQMAQGWLKDAFGIGTDDTASMMEWTGARDGGDGRWAGPFFVCEFYLIETEDRKSRQYSDKIWRIDGEKVPNGVTALKGDEYSRVSPNRTVKKYLVDALEAMDGTDWLGKISPLFPVLGPEIYIEGRLYRLSLISGAIDAQRALNYSATTAIELAGAMPRAPWIGAKGQFDDPRWQTANSEMWAYLEYTPVFATDETTGQQHPMPPPQRNMWEAALQWPIMLKQAFSDDIKAVTSIHDPSLGINKSDQSGKALEQLRSESNVANFSYADNLHRAIEIMYQEMCVIFPKIYDGPRAVAIVRPDSQHEIARINQEFGQDGIDPVTGKKGKKNSLALGELSVRVTADANFQTRQTEALKMMLEAVKVNPNILANPAVTAKLVRMIGQGNPEMEGIADLIAPDAGAESNPAQIGQQLQQAQQQVRQLTQMLQQLHAEMQAKIPELQSKERMNSENNAVKLAIAEIGTKAQDQARVAADALAMQQGHEQMAHDAAMQQVEHEHAAEQQESQQQAAAQSQTQSEQAAAAQQQAEPAGGK